MRKKNSLIHKVCPPGYIFIIALWFPIVSTAAPKIWFKSYKIECNPYYETSTSIFNTPKRREDATIECRSPRNTSLVLEGSVVWAVPCNNIQECYDGEDENGCEFPFWIIPSISFGTGIVLCLSIPALVFILKKIIKLLKIAYTLIRFLQNMHTYTAIGTYTVIRLFPPT